jgi:hypothetical protein
VETAEDAARRAHWANALAEGLGRRAAEEAPWVVRENEHRVFNDEMSLAERCRLANLHPHEILRLGRTGITGPSGGGGGAGPSDRQ